MTADVQLDAVSVAASSWLARGFGEEGPELAAAADGSGAFGHIVFESPAGALTIQGWQAVTVDEADCTGAERLFTGYIADRKYIRGHYSSGADHQIDSNLVDQNVVLSIRVITGTDGKRPAETDVARIAWLLGSPYLSGLIADLGLVNTGAPLALDESDYRDQFPAQVLQDIASKLGKLFFAYWSNADSAVGLFYDNPGASTFDSTLSISNVASDVNQTTCFAPFQEADLWRTPEDTHSLIDYKYLGGARIIATDATTLATYFTANGLGHRGFVLESSRVGRLATANAQVALILADHANEDDVLTIPIELPSTKVGLIQAGMRIGVRMSHWPGYHTQQMVRIERLTIQQAERKPKLYHLVLTCSNRAIAAGSGGGPGPDGFPYEPPTEVAPDYDVTICNTVIEDTNRTAISAPFGTMEPGEDWYYEFRNPQHDPTGSTHELKILADTGGPGVELTNRDDPPEQPGSFGAWGVMPTLTGTFTVPVGGSVASGTAFIFRANIQNYSTTPGVDECWNVKLWRGLTAAPSSPDDPPGAGQPTVPAPPNETPDGVIDEFTTRYPYAAGSLHVTFNGQELTRNVDFTETDPTTGTFTFTNVPPVNSEILVWYQGI